MPAPHVPHSRNDASTTSGGAAGYAPMQLGNVTCWTCGEKGHKANDCPKKAGRKNKGQLKTAAAKGHSNAAAATGGIDDRVNELSE